jgi:hypothetical protein
LTICLDESARKKKKGISELIPRMKECDAKDKRASDQTLGGLAQAAPNTIAIAITNTTEANPVSKGTYDELTCAPWLCDFLLPHPPTRTDRRR